MISFFQWKTMKTLCMAVGFFLLIMGIAHAIMGKISMEALVLNADLILLGRVNSIESFEEKVESKPGQKAEVEFMIWSVAEVVADKVLKGQVAFQPILVEFHVGEDSPNYKSDEEVVVFLKKIESKFSYRTFGMFQGKYTIIDGKVDREGIPVDEFLNKISDILARQVQ